MKIFKKFLDAGFNFQIKDSEVILREDEKIIFEMPFEEDSTIEDLIEENCNHHLKMILTKDPDYFEDTDEYYLQNEWRDLILKIKYLVKGAKMELGENVVEEFIELFQQKFPDISKVIDFEKNRNGNILVGKIIGGNYTIHNINFYKKPEIDKKDFEESLNIFITNHTLEDKSKFVMETLGGMVFEIGDGDDTLAVTYEDILDEYVASIWFRWFGDIKKDKNE